LLWRERSVLAPPPLVASQEGATSPRNKILPGASRGQPDNVWPRARLVGLLVLAVALVALSVQAVERGGSTETAGPDDPPLALAADFAEGTFQGVRREPDGALVLDDGALLAPAERPRAYAERAAIGTYVSPTLPLTRPASRVEASLRADLPPGGQVLLEAR